MNEAHVSIRPVIAGLDTASRACPTCGDAARVSSVRIAPFCTIAFLFRRGTRWLVRPLYFPVFLQIRNLPSPVPRSQAHTHTSSFPRRIFHARGLQLCFAHPNRGVGGAPRVVRVLGGTPVRHAVTRRTRRLRGALRPIARQDARERAYDAGRSPLGAPPWRFWAPGAALLSPAFAPDRIQRATSHPGRSAWRAGSRASRGERLRAATAGRHASLRIQDRL